MIPVTWKGLPTLVKRNISSSGQANNKRFSENAFRSRDDEKNLNSTPPLHEKIQVNCLWCVEYYASGELSSLISALENLKQNSQRIGTRQSPIEFIMRQRQTSLSRGWLNLGILSRQKDAKAFGADYITEIPEPFDFAFGHVFTLSPQITGLTLCFVINSNYSGAFERALRRHRLTKAVPKKAGKGQVIKPPDKQKMEEIEDQRVYFRNKAANWFISQAPGLFSSNILGGEFPTAELTSLRSTVPFEHQQGKPFPWPSWLEALSMDWSPSIWETNDTINVIYKAPGSSSQKNRFHGIFCITEDQIPEDVMKFFGGKNIIGYNNWAELELRPVMEVWGLLPLTIGLEQRFCTIRDITLGNTQSVGGLKNIKNFFQFNFTSYIRDLFYIISLANDILNLCQNPSILSLDVKPFTRRENESNRKLQDMTTELTEALSTRAKWIESSSDFLRNILSQYSGIINSRYELIFTAFVSALTVILVFQSFIGN